MIEQSGQMVLQCPNGTEVPLEVPVTGASLVIYTFCISINVFVICLFLDVVICGLIWSDSYLCSSLNQYFYFNVESTIIKYFNNGVESTRQLLTYILKKMLYDRQSEILFWTPYRIVSIIGNIHYIKLKCKQWNCVLALDWNWI